MNVTSPVQLKDLNPLTEKECESFYKALQCDSMIILASRDGTWYSHEHNTCLHDLLYASQRLIDTALEEMLDHE